MLSLQNEAHDVVAEFESGHLLYFPTLPFQLQAHETHLLNPIYLAPKSKNIGFNAQTQRLWGATGSAEDLQILHHLMQRFADFSHALMERLFPSYTAQLIQGRTSFRPAAVSNRKTSYRKDDRLLHVDAFPSTPTQGLRILRVFSNVNPHGEPRVWHIGEPFEQVARTFLPRIRRPFPGKHNLLHSLHLTKTKRSLYDHYMLNLHNTMKADGAYQQRAVSQKLDLAAGSTWVVATDQVSHAALSGQYLLEQTFYLPINAMQKPECSPYHIIERVLNKPL